MEKKCYIRFDDLCPTMNREQFGRALAVLERCGVKPLIGIIPDNRDASQLVDGEDPLFWQRMKELQDAGFTVAMHGCTHVYDVPSPKTVLCGRKHSEFAGKPYEEQFRLIKEGKEFLASKGIETDVFFAPGHTYDNNTLRALRDNGFRYNIDGLSRRPYRRFGVVQIPCRCFGIPRKLRGPINGAVLHTNEWATEEKAGDYRAFLDYCERFAGQLTDFSEILRIPPRPLVFAKLSEKFYKTALKIKNALRAKRG